MSFAGQRLLICLKLLLTTGAYLCQMFGVRLPGTRDKLLALRQLVRTAGILLSTGQRLTPLIEALGKAPQPARQQTHGHQGDQKPGRHLAKTRQKQVPHEHLLFEHFGVTQPIRTIIIPYG
ncbi:hypothetical protein [Kushneria sp. EE4]